MRVNACALGVQWRAWGGPSRDWVPDDTGFISSYRAPSVPMAPNMPQVGPMTMWVNSTTRRPARGKGLTGVEWYSWRLSDSGLASGQPHTAHSGDRRGQALEVLLSLYRQVYRYSRANGIDCWYAAMERPLARSLLRMNIAFKEIGPLTDYYGPVAPYLANLHEVESQVEARDPALLTWLQHPQADYVYGGLGQKTEFAPLRAQG